MSKIVKAWCIEGRNPAYHRQQQERLRREWPTLYKAIMDEVAKSQVDNCYLEYVGGYLTCTYNHKIGEACLMNKDNN